MCTGPEIMMAVSAAAQGMGMLQNMNAGKEQERALEDAQRAEMIRQQEFDQKRMALIDQTIPDYSADKRAENETAKTAEREGALLPATESIGAIQPYNSSAPTEVTSDLANAMLGALGKGKNYAKSLSKLGAYGAVGQDNGINLGRTAQDLDIINGAGASSMGVYSGAELPEAQRAGNGSKMAGDIFSGLGSIGMLYGNSLGPGAGVKGTVGRTNIGTQGGMMP